MRTAGKNGAAYVLWLFLRFPFWRALSQFRRHPHFRFIPIITGAPKTIAALPATAHISLFSKRTHSFM
jgi:hypothetical protein